MIWPKGMALARLAVYPLIGLLAWHFLRTVGNGDTALDAWLASGKLEHSTVQKLLQRDAQNRQQALQAAHHAMILQGQADSAARRFQMLASVFRQHLDSAHNTPDTAAFQTVVRSCYSAVTLCKARGDSLQRADSLDAARADSLKEALLRSDSSLAAGLQVARCHWLFLSCPSRTRALEYGIVVGLVGGYILVKR